MSIGINLLMEFVDKVSNILFNNNTSVEILDIHHKNKKDAPSGTALALGAAVAKGKNFNLKSKSTMKPNKKRKKQLGKINFFCKRQGKTSVAQRTRVSAKKYRSRIFRWHKSRSRIFESYNLFPST